MKTMQKQTRKLDPQNTPGIMGGMSERKPQRRNTSGTRRLNGHGNLIFKGEGKPYLARWTLAGKTYYRSTGEVVKSKALKRLEEFTKSLREDSLEAKIRELKNQLEALQARKSKQQIPIDSLWGFYADTQRLSEETEHTKRNYRGAVEGMCAWMKRHGVRYAGEITPRLVEFYLLELKKGIGAVTYNCRLVLFKRVWRELMATDANFDLADVWSRFEKQKGVKNSGKRRALTDDELNRVMSKASPEMRLALTICLYTGLRAGDMAHLKWMDCDFTPGRECLKVLPIKTKRLGKRITIPMHRELIPVLKALPRTSEYVSPWALSNYTSGNLRRITKDLFESCGIQTQETDENGHVRYLAGMHSLRHSFVSRAINSGMNPLLVQSIVGHGSVDMTEAYFHANLEAMRKGIDKVA